MKTDNLVLAPFQSNDLFFNVTNQSKDVLSPYKKGKIGNKKEREIDREAVAAAT